MSTWNPVSERRSRGIAIHNFQEAKKFRIQLTFGERVYILKKCGDWYSGYTEKKKSVIGIFPKSFVQVKDPSSWNNVWGNTVNDEQPQIVSEITNILQEWKDFYQKFYINRDSRLEILEHKINKLIKSHHKITVSADNLEEAIWQIDVGNRLLGLDMVVRDDQGNSMNPENSSIIALYRRHVMTTNKINAPLEETESQLVVSPQSRSYTFYLSVRRLACRLTDDIELLFFLYDQKQSKQFTNNFVIICTRRMMALTDKAYNFKALFADLDSRDLNREKVYLVCYAIRKGSMEQDSDCKINVRRPLAVACFNLTEYFKNDIEPDVEMYHSLLLLSCDKDTLENTLRRCFVLGESTQDKCVQHIQVNFQLVPLDYKQLLEVNPYFSMDNLAIVRKIGFAEIYEKDNIRNELFVTIIRGEFPRGQKTSEKNIEIMVSLCDSNGTPIKGKLSMGNGIEPLDEYYSMIHYHQNKPSWNEIFNVALPVNDYENLHLKFLFRHRPSKSKFAEKHENPFALAYVRLSQENGAILKNGLHSLLIYKIDQKRYNFVHGNYLLSPSTTDDLIEGMKSTTHGLAYEKDIFIIQTNLCSTKHTQNAKLFDFLCWSDYRENISQILTAMMEVDHKEIIKFLDDVFDTLFEIIAVNFDSNVNDDLLFTCLVHLIGITLKKKYQYLRPLLDSYIEESFNAESVYDKLMTALTNCFQNVAYFSEESLNKTMNALKYIMKFITKSAYLYSKKFEDYKLEIFEDCLTKFFQLIARHLRAKPIATLLLDAGCVKQLISSIPDIMTVINPVQLSLLYVELISSLSNHTHLVKKKLEIIHEIILSPLFLIPDCRAELLNKFLYAVKPLLENSNELPWFIRILNDILDLMRQPEFKFSSCDINEVVSILLRTIIRTIVRMDSGRLLMSKIATIMISIFRQMSWVNFHYYMNHFASRSEIMDFVLEVLGVFEILLKKRIYRSDWSEIILIQNSVILKVLQYLSHTICDHFDTPFEHTIWNSFFRCTVEFILQPALQLEKFLPRKRARILSKYYDMRSSAGIKTRFMWYKLGQNKIHFIPHLVEPFLKVSLIPEENLRICTIPLFYDMMQTEFNSTCDGVAKFNFCEFEEEMFTKLDALVESGQGDEQYVTLFSSIMMSNCESNTASLKEKAVRFITNVTSLMERLMIYRSVINHQSKPICICYMADLLRFYSSIKRYKMYVHYVNKVCEWHSERDNYAEAAFALKLYSDLLSWSDEILSPSLRTPQFSHCNTHRQLKEALYQDIIVFFDKGEMWEYAMEICKELVIEYEEVSYDYGRLSLLLKRMSQLYENIISIDRTTPEYFRVAYYGKGFPPNIRNGVFIRRGSGYEKLVDFIFRAMNEFPNATLLQDLSPPSLEILEAPGQFMQINHVKPIMDEEKQKFFKQTINDKILKFYEVNGISKFQYDRPFRRKEEEDDDDKNNEFAVLWQKRTTLEVSNSLPNFLRWSSVVSSKTRIITPLEGAVEKMQHTNNEFREMVIKHKNDITLPYTNLEMRLSSILSSPVNGGIGQYEEAFLTPKYLERHPLDADLVSTLKDSIASLIPLLEIGVEILCLKISMFLRENNLPQTTIILMRESQITTRQQFEKLKADIEAKYGERKSDIEFDKTQFRKNVFPHYSLLILHEKRWSQISEKSSVLDYEKYLLPF